MLELIKTIINYVPRGSVEDMLNVRLFSFAAIETERTEEKESDIFSAMATIPGYSETSYPTTVETKMLENKVQEVALKKSKHTEDILSHILDTFEKGYIEGKNYDKKFTVIRNAQNYKRQAMMLMTGCYGVIAMNSRMGPANVAILPKDLYDIIKQSDFPEFKIFCNPLEEYNDKIFIIRKEQEDNIFQQKYHLITDGRIPSDREAKINKILDKDEEENREINYAIIPVYGHGETVIVINIV